MIVNHHRDDSDTQQRVGLHFCLGGVLPTGNDAC